MVRALDGINFYRRVPADLSKSTPFGGVLSIVAAAAMLALLWSNACAFFKVEWSSSTAIDQSYDRSLRVNFNLTLHRMPCRYLAIDIQDALGASVLNITTGIVRERVLASGERVTYSARKPVKSWQRLLALARKPPPGSAARARSALAPQRELARLAADELRLVGGNFTTFVRSRPRSMVLFGAGWCEWTQAMLLDWREAAATIAAAHDDAVGMAFVDCARADSAAVCARHFVQAFPAVHVYERDLGAGHRNYVGERTAEALIAFARAAASVGAAGAAGKRALATPFHSNLARSESGNEGCAVAGSAFVARVPGSLRLGARLDGHSFNPRWVDMDHSIVEFSFGVPDARERLAHAREIREITALHLQAAVRERTGGGGGGDDGHFVHVEHLAVLPQHARGSPVVAFRPSARKGRFSHFVAGVERLRAPKGQLDHLLDGDARLRAKQARVHTLHAADTHGPNSLGGHSFVSQLSFVSAEHYLSCVPTTYRFSDGDELDAYTYTVQNRESVRSYAPTVVFSYNFSPLRVLIAEKHADLASFLTQVCAVVGGVFTVVGLVDALLFNMGDLIARKMQLGKAI